MKVFISWSGERSQAVAQSLREWLPLVLHYVEPWLSDADVAAGDRWAQEIGKELETTNFGIICVTPENVGSPWVLFEAGALAKSMQGAKVIPLLFNLEFSDVTGPLAQFQAKKLTKIGVGEVIQSINHATDQAIPDDRAKQLFGALWSELEGKLGAVPEQAPTERHTRPQREVLEELVAGVRSLESRFRDLENFADTRPRPYRHSKRRLHPAMVDEMAHIASKGGDDSVSLLMFASFIRDDLPWLYELVTEVYRELNRGDQKATQKAVDRLHRVTKMLRRGPYMEMMMDGSKDSHIFMMEFQRALENFLRRYELQRLEKISGEGGADGIEESNP